MGAASHAPQDLGESVSRHRRRVRDWDTDDSTWDEAPAGHTPRAPDGGIRLTTQADNTYSDGRMVMTLIQIEPRGN